MQQNRRDQIVNALADAGYAISAGSNPRAIRAVQPAPGSGQEMRGHVEQIAEMLRLEGAEGAECTGRTASLPMRGFTTYRFRLLGSNEPL